MFSCKLIVFVAALALAPTEMAQEQVPEQMVTEQRVTEQEIAGQQVPEQDVTARRVTALIDELKDDETRDRAADELSRAGRVAIPLLTEFLSWSGEDALSQEEAILSILGRMGPDAASELDFLFTYGVECEAELLLPLVLTVADIAPYGSSSMGNLVGDLHGLVQRRLVTQTLFTALQLGQKALVERMKVDPRASTDELIGILASNAIYQRVVAAEELGRRRARAAIPLLCRGVADTGTPDEREILVKNGRSIGVTDDFKARAVRALLMIDPDDPRVAVAHAYQLRTRRDTQTRLEAAMALGRCGAAAAPAVPELLAAMTDRDEEITVIREAVTALGMIGPKAADAVPILETLIEHQDRQIAARAKAALRQIKGDR